MKFVAVIGCLVQAHKVQVVPAEGESLADSRKRALAVCEDSELLLLLRMRDADSIRLLWRPK